MLDFLTLGSDINLLKIFETQILKNLIKPDIVDLGQEFMAHI